MKIDTHIIFLIIIIGIISAGIVGATVMSNDDSMKQEDFDGIKIYVPSDSNFVQTSDGVYKDDNNGITINTFKNNDSMIDFLKNTKKSKIIPIENQPPQSVAFKKGNSINILVTNGEEGVAVSSDDGELTAKIANSIIFSNNHKSAKSPGVSVIHPRMSAPKDFNLIMLLVAEVDTKVFNLALIEENIDITVNEYNENIGVPDEDISSESESDEYVSDIEDQNDLNEILNLDSDSSQDEEAQTTSVIDDDSSNAEDNGVISDDASDLSNQGSGDDVLSSPDDSVQELSYEDCELLVTQELDNYHPGCMIDNYEEIENGYLFKIVDDMNNPVGEITVDALTGELNTTNLMI